MRERIRVRLLFLYGADDVGSLRHHGRGDYVLVECDTREGIRVRGRELGAIINLDDITHIDFLETARRHIPETISCRYNPGGVFKMSNGIMDNPGDAKYGHYHGADVRGLPYSEAEGREAFRYPCVSGKQHGDE